MIRRESIIGDGGAPSQRRWILISQVDHAHLAGEVARHWGAPGFATLAPRDELLWAIDHHDDGWQSWEQAPDVEETSHRPRSFTEMKPHDAQAIWSASIDAAARAGNLQAAVVAGHFCALASRATAWRNNPPDAQATEAFMARYQQRIAGWLRDWRAEDPAANTPAKAQLALSFLQFFDWLSLWFCCWEATEVGRMETPAGPTLTLTPDDREHIRLTPWPLVTGSLDLEIPARAVPAKRYSDAAELAAAPSQSVLLRWRLRPAAEKVDEVI